MARRRRRSRARFLNDPFRTLANWAVGRYGLGRVDIRFIPDEKRLRFLGRTTFRARRVPYIELNARVRVDNLLGVLAHELAHVAQYRRRRPGKRWGRHDKPFDGLLKRIESDWIARCNRQEKGKRK